jgi:ABC-type antimicrobial peptide transport system permease subunit
MIKLLLLLETQSKQELNNFKKHFNIEIGKQYKILVKMIFPDNTEITTILLGLSRISGYPIICISDDERKKVTGYTITEAKFKDVTYNTSCITIVSALEDHIPSAIKVDIKKEISDIVLEKFGLTEYDLMNSTNFETFKRELKILLMTNE